MRSTLPIIVAFIAGIAMVISFFFNPERTVVGQFQENLLQWVTCAYNPLYRREAFKKQNMRLGAT